MIIKPGGKKTVRRRLTMAPSTTTTTTTTTTVRVCVHTSAVLFIRPCSSPRPDSCVDTPEVERPRGRRVNGWKRRVVYSANVRTGLDDCGLNRCADSELRLSYDRNEGDWFHLTPLSSATSSVGRDGLTKNTNVLRNSRRREKRIRFDQNLKTPFLDESDKKKYKSLAYRRGVF